MSDCFVDIKCGTRSFPTSCCTRTSPLTLNSTVCVHGVQTHHGNCHCSCDVGWVGTMCSSRQPHVAAEVVLSGINSRRFLAGTQSDFCAAVSRFLSPQSTVEIDSFFDVATRVTIPEISVRVRILMKLEVHAIQTAQLLATSSDSGEMLNALQRMGMSRLTGFALKDKPRVYDKHGTVLCDDVLYPCPPLNLGSSSLIEDSDTSMDLKLIKVVGGILGALLLILLLVVRLKSQGHPVEKWLAAAVYVPIDLARSFHKAYRQRRRSRLKTRSKANLAAMRIRVAEEAMETLDQRSLRLMPLSLDADGPGKRPPVGCYLSRGAAGEAEVLTKAKAPRSLHARPNALPITPIQRQHGLPQHPHLQPPHLTTTTITTTTTHAEYFNVPLRSAAQQDCDKHPLESMSTVGGEDSIDGGLVDARYPLASTAHTSVDTLPLRVNMRVGSGTSTLGAATSKKRMEANSAESETSIQTPNGPQTLACPITAKADSPSVEPTCRAPDASEHTPPRLFPRYSLFLPRPRAHLHAQRVGT